MSEEVLLSDITKNCIDTLNSNGMTPEEEAQGYFIWKNLKTLKTWEEWKKRENKQINQFTMQDIIGKPSDPMGIPKNSIILILNWLYAVKQSSVGWSWMCYNGSKKPAPQLHAVASTWSSYYNLTIILL